MTYLKSGQLFFNNGKSMSKQLTIIRHIEMNRDYEKFLVMVKIGF